MPDVLTHLRAILFRIFELALPKMQFVTAGNHLWQSHTLVLSKLFIFTAKCGSYPLKIHCDKILCRSVCKGSYLSWRYERMGSFRVLSGVRCAIAFKCRPSITENIWGNIPWIEENGRRKSVALSTLVTWDGHRAFCQVWCNVEIRFASFEIVVYEHTFHWHI